jgi:HEAT repeat protein
MGFFGPNVEQMTKKKDFQGLIKALKDEKNVKVRFAAAQALGRIEFRKEGMVLSALDEAQGDSDEYVRRAATISRNYLIEINEKMEKLDHTFQKEDKKMAETHARMDKNMRDTLDKIAKQ